MAKSFLASAGFDAAGYWKDLARIGGFPQSAQQVMAEEISKALRDYEAGGGGLSAAAKRLGIPMGDLTSASAAVVYLAQHVVGGQTTLDQVFADLGELGLGTPEQHGEVRRLADALLTKLPPDLSMTQERLRSTQRGLPSFESIYASADIRGVERHPRPIYAVDDPEYDGAMADFVPVGILTIVLQQQSGQSTDVTFQVGRLTLKQLVVALGNLTKELEHLDKLAARLRKERENESK